METLIKIVFEFIFTILFHYVFHKTGAIILMILSLGKWKIAPYTKSSLLEFPLWKKDQSGQIVFSDLVPILTGLIFWVIVAWIILGR